MAGRNHGAIGRRKLWRRYHKRKFVELWDYVGRVKLKGNIEAPYGPLSDDESSALGVQLQNRTKLWRLPELLLDGIEPRTEQRIKEVDSGIWWEIRQVVESGADHFRDCRCVLLEVDG